MSRLLYPVIYTIEYASGSIDNLMCERGWPQVKKYLDLLKAAGAVKDYRFSTRSDRQLRGQTVTRDNKVVSLRPATRLSFLARKYPPKWRR